MGSAAISTPQPAIHEHYGSRLPLLKQPVLLSAILVIATVALYYPVHHLSFINFDDNDYVYRNAHVQAGLTWATVKWAFTKAAAANWHPVTWLSHALDCQLFGLNPAGHHDVNVLFHAINVVLLFWVLLAATGYIGRSFTVAALFALHPINVESVAWVAERKTLISMMFFLLALGAYTWCVKRGRKSFIVVDVLFILGLMAKPQIIAFPFVLLLWDYWPLGRIAIRNSPFALRQSAALNSPGEPERSSGEKRTANSEERLPGERRSASDWRALIREKEPLFLIALASAIVTLRVQHGARAWYPRLSRVGNAILSYALYVKKAVWPTRLAVLYPHPGASINWWHVSLAAVVLLAITACVLAGGRHKYLPVGWCWFLGTLVPMMGIVQVGVQSMADRYAYLSFIGLFIMICWGGAELAAARHVPPMLLATTTVVVLIALGVTARRQLDFWNTEIELWEHALAVTDRNYVAEAELGTALSDSGRLNESLPHFKRALRISPRDPNSNLGMAIYDLRTGNYSDAVVHFRVVANDDSVQPDERREAYTGMAQSYWVLGDNDKAKQCLNKAQQLN